MRKDTKTFVLFKKHLKNGKYMYYYVVRDENNRRLQYSTGKEDMQEAMAVCLSRMAQGKLIPKSRLRFSDYAKDFYNFDTSRYIQGRLSRGFSYGRASADNRNNFINKVAIPFFGDKLMTLISPADIEAFLQKLKRSGLSNTSVNNNYKHLKVIFGEAVRLHDIPLNPCDSVRMFHSDTKEKGIFSEAETASLFEATDALEKCWHGDTTAYTLNLLALHSGCRLGEIQGLCVKDLQGDRIIISKSWNEKYGLGSTKTGKTRIIPIGDELRKNLLMLCWGKGGDDFIFGNRSGNRPLARTKIYAKFHSALDSVGITENERKKRNLSFHCWRHTFASRLANANVPELYIRRLTGHSSAQILDVYSHIQIDKLKEAINF